jgi:hypothetical protein
MPFLECNAVAPNCNTPGFTELCCRRPLKSSESQYSKQYGKDDIEKQHQKGEQVESIRTERRSYVEDSTACHKQKQETQHPARKVCGSTMQGAQPKAERNQHTVKTECQEYDKKYASHPAYSLGFPP